MTTNKSKPVKVLAQWQEFVVTYEKNRAGAERPQGRWTNYEQPEVLKASLGESKLTVWLPSGKRVVCSRSRTKTLRDTQKRFYGNYFGRPGDRRRTIFTIMEQQ